MPHELDLILTVTAGLGAALVFGIVTQRLRLSPIVGYLLAGIVVGPFTPGFVARTDLAQQLAELGVILLMFGVGLQFRISELVAVKNIALPGALAQIAVATGLGVVLARFAGWSYTAGVIFGLCISVASTVVLLRLLSDRDLLHTPGGHVAMGWLIVEDVFTVLVLVLIPAFAGTGEMTLPAMGKSLLIALLKLAALGTLLLLGGRRLIPWLLGYVAKTRSRELFTLTVLVLALGIAVFSAEVFGASMALGAFLAGLVVGQSQFSFRAASEALPMRDAFAVLFFVSVGMLFDPMQLFDHLSITLGAIAIVIVGKAAAAYAIVWLLRHPMQTAITVAAGLAQIGEFSFILGELGRKHALIPAVAMQVLVGASIVSIVVSPLLFGGLQRLARRAAAPTSSRPAEPRRTGHAIVVGYGPVGRTLTRLLVEHQLQPVVIELNHESVTSLQEQGLEAVYGDATRRDILESAGVRQASSLVFAASGTPSEVVIRAARELNPDLRILARSAFVAETAAARKAGADVVVTAEAEVALAMAEHLLTALGATAEQLDRTRDRLRSELRGASESAAVPA
jgi:CPA2 family monovalent cation:H+ antiporter-2